MAHRILSRAYLAIAIAVLSIYGTRVCPFIDSLGGTTIVAVFTIGFTLAGVVRELFQHRFVDTAPYLERPRRQFWLDLITFTVAGTGISLFDYFYFGFPLESGLKVLLGSVTLGTFAALDNALLRQREGVREAVSGTSPPSPLIPLTRTLSWVFGALAVMLGVVVALILIKDMEFIVANVSAQTSKYIRLAVLGDIAFVIAVILILAVRLGISFRRNFGALFAIQLNALEEIERGNFDTRVPLTTRDEFSVVAAHLNRMIQGVRRARDQERELFEMSLAIASEIKLQPLLMRIMHTAAKFVDCERTTLFLHDPRRNQLWSVVAKGLTALSEIRIQSDQGIAGHVFNSGEVLNIADAYEDPRFDPETDVVTGFRTKTMLCVPIIDRTGQRLGVIQALNKRSGAFTDADAEKLRSFSAQAAIALVNAQLFEDVTNMRNYDESILKSLSDGVVTLDSERNVTKVNRAAMAMLESGQRAVGSPIGELFREPNQWVVESLDRVAAAGEPVLTLDCDIALGAGRALSVNLNTVPLIDLNDEPIGAMYVIEDISREKRLRSAMSRYMTKEIADRVMESGEFTLGGSNTHATVLFSDIRGFTSLSETLGARATVSLLNEYFSVMVDRIFEQQGILDKYIGDAIMAVFGAPFSTEKDADNAVITAVRMMEGLAELNTRRTARGEVPIDIGVGISSGELVAGNIGSTKRMDYTVIGDTVNLAARLESINKLYGTHIVASESTVRQLQGTYRLRELDRLRVKGKDEPVIIHEVLEYHTEETFPRMDAALQTYAAGMVAYLHGDWTRALKLFGETSRLVPDDGPSQLYTQRCQQFIERPPTEDWDGVWSMQHK